MEIIIETPATIVADIIQRVCADPDIKSDLEGLNKAIYMVKEQLGLCDSDAVKAIQKQWIFEEQPTITDELEMRKIGIIFS